MNTETKLRISGIVVSFLFSIGFGWVFDLPVIARSQDPDDARYATQRVRWISVAGATAVAMAFAANNTIVGAAFIPVIWLIVANRVAVQGRAALPWGDLVWRSGALLRVLFAAPLITIVVIALGDAAESFGINATPLAAIAKVVALTGIILAAVVGFRAGRSYVRDAASAAQGGEIFMENLGAALGLREAALAKAVEVGTLQARFDALGNITVVVPMDARALLQNEDALAEGVARYLPECELGPVQPSFFVLHPVSEVELERREARRLSGGLFDERLDGGSDSGDLVAVDWSQLD